MVVICSVEMLLERVGNKVGEWSFGKEVIGWEEYRWGIDF